MGRAGQRNLVVQNETRCQRLGAREAVRQFNDDSLRHVREDVNEQIGAGRFGDIKLFAGIAPTVVVVVEINRDAAQAPLAAVLSSVTIHVVINDAGNRTELNVSN